MANGVFHQRLQDETGHRRMDQCMRQVQIKHQTRPHANRHQTQVIVQARKLISQRVQWLTRGLQGGAQIVVQVVQHGQSPRRVLPNQGPQMRQRVEQHVGFELRLQQHELRLRDLLSQ